MPSGVSGRAARANRVTPITTSKKSQSCQSFHAIPSNGDPWKRWLVHIRRLWAHESRRFAEPLKLFFTHLTEALAKFTEVNIVIVLSESIHGWLQYNGLMQNLPQLAPMTLSRLREPFDDPDWLFELKHDGFRTLAYVERGKCELISRRRNVYKSFESLREAISRLLRVDNAILDGEIVSLDASGHSLFNKLLFRRGEPVLYAFDLLWLNGRDLRGLPLHFGWLE
jgi:hypothetical protein